MIAKYFDFLGLVPEAIIIVLVGIGLIVFGFVVGYALQEIKNKWF